MSIILKNDRLTVEIAKPGEAPNTTRRFDRAGFVTQVTLDGKHTFCSREPDNLPHPSTGGYGLCNEYRLPAPALEAGVGEKFPKPGIGIMTKDIDGKFVMYHQYPCDDYDIDITCTDTSATFCTKAKPCMGYAISQTKVLMLDGNQLRMEIELKNVGDVKLEFDEYCHNFVTIDRLPIGPDYFISLPVTSQVGKSTKSGIALVGKENGVGFAEYSNEPTLFDIDGSEFIGEAPFTWKLTHQKTSAAVSETVSLMPEKMVIWTIDHIVSPEAICHFELEVGEAASWSRTWTFTD